MFFIGNQRGFQLGLVKRKMLINYYGSNMDQVGLQVMQVNMIQKMLVHGMVEVQLIMKGYSILTVSH